MFNAFAHTSRSPETFLGPFRIFSKIRGDIRSSRLTTGINDTGGNFATSSAYQQLKQQIATDINDTGSKFATGVSVTGGKQLD